nr:histidine kinase dimerization/phospho-acceptor domain-containing protein [uncultured Desulfobacter sp.]
MKKPIITLKWFVILSFLVMAAVLIIGYSVLSVRFFFKGMDNIIAGNMVHVLESYVKTTPEDQRNRLAQFSGFMIAKQWEQMPENIKYFMDCPQATGKLLVRKEDTWFGKPKRVVFATSLQLGKEIYYVVLLPSPHKASPLIGNRGKENMRLLLGISLLTAFGIAVLIQLLLKRVERPVKLLGQWARGLDADQLKAPAPDFIYPELNELARLIQKSLSSVQESLDREHTFLRHASHELRTPICVIRNNVELLKKLDEQAQELIDVNPDKISRYTRQKNKTIDRIDRASLTMKHLTQTLLWLGQDEQVQLSVSAVNLEHFVLELVEEAGYLLKNKDGAHSHFPGHAAGIGLCVVAMSFKQSQRPALKYDRSIIIFSAFSRYQKVHGPFRRKFTTLRIELSIAPLPIGKFNAFTVGKSSRLSLRTK